MLCLRLWESQLGCPPPSRLQSLSDVCSVWLPGFPSYWGRIREPCDSIFLKAKSSPVPFLLYFLNEQVPRRAEGACVTRGSGRDLSPVWPTVAWRPSGPPAPRVLMRIRRDISVGWVCISLCHCWSVLPVTRAATGSLCGAACP